MSFLEIEALKPQLIKKTKRNGKARADNSHIVSLHEMNRQTKDIVYSIEPKQSGPGYRGGIRNTSVRAAQ
ncbi:MAG TPA: hypothetical protein VGL19_20970, partial [Polyangiaceae bacterium]